MAVMLARRTVTTEISITTMPVEVAEAEVGDAREGGEDQLVEEEGVVTETTATR